ncbi:hypothetical protein [Nostoc sp.]|uniref:hypothetical protein n=1 Tax=Nostoc sp. TaxID=1180 RepID=UPI002FFD1D3E
MVSVLKGCGGKEHFQFTQKRCLLFSTRGYANETLRVACFPVGVRRAMPTQYNNPASAKEAHDLNLLGFTQWRSLKLQHIFIKNIF